VPFRELRTLGYSGGIDHAEAVPGDAQADGESQAADSHRDVTGAAAAGRFRHHSARSRALSVFIATLGWSRAAYVEFIEDEWLKALLSGHEHAFDCFGGVPREDAYGPGQHRYNQTFFDFAHHYRFRPRLCKRLRSQTKGKVQRFIRYLRGRFYVPLASQLSPERLKVDHATYKVQDLTVNY
jgi:transposase